MAQFRYKFKFTKGTGVRRTLNTWHLASLESDNQMSQKAHNEIIKKKPKSSKEIIMPFYLTVYLQSTANTTKFGGSSKSILKATRENKGLRLK